MTLEFLKSKDYKKWRVRFERQYRERKKELEDRSLVISENSDNWSYWSHLMDIEENEEIYQRNLDWCFFYIRYKVKTCNITG